MHLIGDHFPYRFLKDTDVFVRIKLNHACCGSHSLGLHHSPWHHLICSQERQTGHANSGSPLHPVMHNGQTQSIFLHHRDRTLL